MPPVNFMLELLRPLLPRSGHLGRIATTRKQGCHNCFFPVKFYTEIYASGGGSHHWRSTLLLRELPPPENLLLLCALLTRGLSAIAKFLLFYETPIGLPLCGKR